MRENTRKLDLEYETTRYEKLSDYHHDLAYLHVVQSNILEDANLNDLFLKRIDILTTNVQYGKIDMSKIIAEERQLVQHEIRYIANIRSLYQFIYKFRAISLIDIRDNSNIVEFTSVPLNIF